MILYLLTNDASQMLSEDGAHIALRLMRISGAIYSPFRATAKKLHHGGKVSTSTIKQV